MTTPADTERVYTLDDLRSWNRAGPSLAVIGHPVAHSKSPLMHNAALAELRRQEPERFRDWAYFKFDIEPERLREALKLFQQKNFAGLNLTLPHKVLVMQWILPLSLTAVARSAGAMNTLRLDSEFGYAWHNTDGIGFRIAVRERLSRDGRHGAVSCRPVVLLGAGGAARAIAANCLYPDAGLCASLHIAARDADKAAAFAGLFKGQDAGVPITSGSLDDVVFPPDALVVNCTSLGLKPTDAAPVRAAALHPDLWLYDTTYAEEPSTLMRDAIAAGIPASAVSNGLSMLCAQGAEALRFWLGGKTYDVDFEAVMWAALGNSGSFFRRD